MLACKFVCIMSAGACRPHCEYGNRQEVAVSPLHEATFQPAAGASKVSGGIQTPVKRPLQLVF